MEMGFVYWAADDHLMKFAVSTDRINADSSRGVYRRNVTLHFSSGFHWIPPGFDVYQAKSRPVSNNGSIGGNCP